MSGRVVPAVSAATAYVQGVVGQFCDQLGLPHLNMPMSLRLEQSGQLHLSEQGGVFSALLARSIPLHQRGVAAAALAAVHPDNGLPFPVRAAFRGNDTLVLLSRLPSDRLDLPALDGMVRLLTDLSRTIASAEEGR